MKDNTQEIDEILAAKFATKPDGGVWCTIHSHRLEVGVCRSCEAKQALLDWHNKQVEAVLDRLLREYELDIQSKWFSSSGGMVDLSSAIEAERNKLKESK